MERAILLKKQLQYRPGPPDNPLKGFMPFKGVYIAPHSMEWWYIPLRDLMDGPDSYTFETGLEPILDEIASRGHQAVFRIYLEYPGRETGVPQFLIDEGLKFHDYTEFGGGKEPDYHDPRLIDTLEKFIREFGRRYDGDPRIGFITCGLIGHWGEWHTYPDEERMPSVEDQNRLFRAYDEAFNQTRILARYPTSGDVAKMNIGFHDDSFAFSTLPTVWWNFMSLMKKAGAEDKWMTEPIGGELRPEIQLTLWDETPSEKAEDFDECVNQTHASWLIAHQVFANLMPGSARLERAMEGARKLGYDLFVSGVEASVTGEAFELKVEIENKGVAPFYYNWTVQLAVADDTNTIVSQWDTGWKLTEVLPGAPVEWTDRSSNFVREPGTYTLLMRVVNPLKQGKAFRFANEEQDGTLEGWLSLGTFELK